MAEFRDMKPILLPTEESDVGVFCFEEEDPYRRRPRSTKWSRIATVAVLSVTLLCCIGAMRSQFGTPLHTNFGAVHTIELADQMLAKDIDVHRAKFEAFKRSRLLSGTEEQPYETVDTVADNLENLYEKKEALRTAIAQSVANSLQLVISGASGEDVSVASYKAASDLFTSTLSVSFPMLSIVAVTALSMLEGVFFQHTTSETEQLYTQIMTEVKELIEANNINNQLKSVKNHMLSITDEMIWIPELVETATDDVQMSSYLALQSHMAFGVRDAFGGCYDDLTSDDCKTWQKAGTLEIGLEFAQLHLQILSDLYALNSASDDFKTLLQQKIIVMAVKYRCVLLESYNAYAAYRAGSDFFEKVKKWSHGRRRESKKAFYDWKVAVTDTYTGEKFYKKEGRETKKCDTSFNQKKCNSKMDDYVDKKAKAAKSSYIVDMKAKFDTEYKDPIETLTGFLTGDNLNDPCTQAGMDTR